MALLSFKTAVVFFLSFCAYCAIGQDNHYSQKDHSLAGVIRNYHWQCPIDARKLEQSETRLTQDPNWNKLIDLIGKANDENEQLEYKLLDDLSSKSTFPEKKEVAITYIKESQKRSDKFFEDVMDLVDPIQQREALQKGQISNSSWAYDPLVYYLVDADDKVFEKVRETQIPRLNLALKKWSEGQSKINSDEDKIKLTHTVAFLNLDNSLTTLGMLDKQSRGKLIQLQFTEGGTVKASEQLQRLSEHWLAFAPDEESKSFVQARIEKLKKIIAEHESED